MTTHQHGGSDEIATAMPGANVVPKASANSRLAAGFQPLLIDTADRGYFFGVTVQIPDSSGATTAFSMNAQRVWQFVLPYAVTVNQIAFEVVATSGAGTSLGLGLWDAACSTVVLESGVMSAGGTRDINVAGLKTKAIIGGPVALNPGVYWLAMATDSTTVTLPSMALPSQAINLVNAQTNKKFAQGGEQRFRRRIPRFLRVHHRRGEQPAANGSLRAITASGRLPAERAKQSACFSNHAHQCVFAGAGRHLLCGSPSAVNPVPCRDRRDESEAIQPESAGHRRRIGRYGWTSCR